MSELTDYGATPARDVIDLNQVRDEQAEDNHSDDKPKSLKLTGFDVPLSRDIPKRPWVYGRSYLGGVVSGTIAPGGAGKSSVTLAEAIAMASMPNDMDQTHSFLNKWTKRGLRVCYLNLEDPMTEQKRRAAAIIDKFGIDRNVIRERLLISDSVSFGLCFAEMDGGRAVVSVDLERLEKAISKNNIDVVVIDPFVSAHNVSENDNGAIDTVIKAIGGTARRTGAAIHLVHHVTKLRGDTLSQDSARGASAFVDGLRALRGIVKMTQTEAENAGLQSPQGYIRAEDMKTNYVQAEKGDWYHLQSFELENGDWVGVPVPWKYPDALDDFDGSQAKEIILAIQAAQPVRKDPQTHGEWAGTFIGEVMGWDVPDGRTKPKERTPEQCEALAKAKRALRAWETSGTLIEGEMKHPTKSNKTVKTYSVDPDKIPCATT